MKPNSDRGRWPQTLVGLAEITCGVYARSPDDTDPRIPVMTVRRLRWLAAMVVAAVAAVATPARSAAATQIIVTETDLATGNPKAGGFSQTFTPLTLPTVFDTKNFTSVKIAINSTSGLEEKDKSDFHSISTSLNIRLAQTGFDPTIGLQVKVIDDAFLNLDPNVGGNGRFTGNVTTTAGGANTTNKGEATYIGNSNVKLGPTIATATSENAVAAGFPVPPPPQSNVSNIPNRFSIEQVINFSADRASTGTFTAGVSNIITTDPNPAVVPAPPAAVLALTAFPLFGLRRVLRKKSA